MKKFIHGFLDAVLSACMLLGAAACGGNGDNGGNGGSGGDAGDVGTEEPKPNKMAPAYASPDALLEVGGVPEKNADISDELFGVFLEDINYASQALDDNMVANGSFETVSGAKYNEKYGWTAADGATLSVTKAGSALDGLYDQDDTVLMHAEVTTPAGGTLTNSGYAPVPMAVEEGQEYLFSAFIKTSQALGITVSVTDGEEEYGSVTLPVETGGWAKYERTLKATGTAAEGLRLQLTFSAAATVSLDAVSLETKDSTVGIKNYIYSAIKELSPKFIRFPGGCITEGENFNQTYDWKNSIGAVQTGENAGDDAVPAFTYTLDTEEGGKNAATYGEYITRRPNVNLWENDGSEYFLMDYGVGFYEYFLLCDSLGASALPVVSCGLSCQGQAYPGAPLAGRHGKGVEDYIRDAADLIEFAKGDKSTKWGGIRADMGHPEPFEMNYIGIGNEQWDAGTPQTDYFETYYEKFLEDAHFMETCRRYGVQLIVGNHQQLIHCEGSIDFATGQPRTSGIAKDAAIAYRSEGKITALSEYGIHDQHYYNSPVDFLLNTHMYDNYVREGNDRYEVFVGEYSANNNFRDAGNFSNLYTANNWFSALSEAAAMTGFERNGDIVRLAAYAPMFAPVKTTYRHWPVDMMLFTNTQLVRTANYYVQQLFMQSTGTKKLSSTLTLDEDFVKSYTLNSLDGRTAEIEKLYYVTSLDEKTGDIIVKLVNAGEDSVRLNVSAGREIAGYAELARLYGELQDVNTLGDTFISLRTSVLGGYTDGVIGLALDAYSVTCLRLHTK